MNCLLSLLSCAVPPRDTALRVCTAAVTIRLYAGRTERSLFPAVPAPEHRIRPVSPVRSDRRARRGLCAGKKGRRAQVKAAGMTALPRLQSSGEKKGAAAPRHVICSDELISFKAE